MFLLFILPGLLGYQNFLEKFFMAYLKVSSHINTIVVDEAIISVPYKFQLHSLLPS